MSEYQETNISNTIQDIKNGWMEFEFSSSEAKTRQKESKTDASASLDATYYNVLWGVSGMYIYVCFIIG